MAELHERFQFEWDERARCLQLTPRRPVLASVKTVLDGLNTLLRQHHWGRMPTIGELLETMFQQDFGHSAMEQAIDILYGSVSETFYAIPPGQRSLDVLPSSRPIGTHWMERQWNQKAEGRYLTSEAEIRWYRWADGMEGGVDLDHPALMFDLANAPRTKVVVLRKSTELPVTLRTTPGPAGLFEFEAFLRTCEQRLGVNFAEKPIKQACTYMRQSARLIAYPLYLQEKDRPAHHFIVVTLGEIETRSIFEAMYEAVAIPGVIFEEFLRLRSTSTLPFVA